MLACTFDGKHIVRKRGLYGAQRLELGAAKKPWA